MINSSKSFIVHSLLSQCKGGIYIFKINNDNFYSVRIFIAVRFLLPVVLHGNHVILSFIKVVVPYLKFYNGYSE